ncbi:uncharacterized protein N7459_008366 [Penicillium hispanicum]|uniref:uncharacterized protein n=1 Tax=Penicillium hispanicum TaxID=1080232 RepID=UPI00254032FB|nr:uncharacterized protein N7459_008366 [Penicillium hispanicum]KAJ5573939.1 hypothetical protein N7459_008366 [Penicillium hispanicum]
MSFVAVPLLKFGFNKAKQHREKKKQQQQFQDAAAAGYPNQYPQQPYPMAEYPPGVAPGANIQFAPPAPPVEPASKGTKLVSMFVSALRFLQFVFGLTVIGLYGTDVRHDHQDKDSWSARWVYALVAAFLATATAAVHMCLPFCMRRVNYTPSPALRLPQFVWEFVLCILWLTLFGIFGKMYIGVYPSSDSDSSKRDTSSSATSGLGDASKINRMRHAVWVDLVNLVMWVFTASWVLLRWLKSRRAAAGSVMDDAEKGEQI